MIFCTGRTVSIRSDTLITFTSTSTNGKGPLSNGRRHVNSTFALRGQGFRYKEQFHALDWDLGIPTKQLDSHDPALLHFYHSRRVHTRKVPHKLSVAPLKSRISLPAGANFTPYATSIMSSDHISHTEQSVQADPSSHPDVGDGRTDPQSQGISILATKDQYNNLMEIRDRLWELLENAKSGPEVKCICSYELGINGYLRKVFLESGLERIPMMWNKRDLEYVTNNITSETIRNWIQEDREYYELFLDLYREDVAYCKRLKGEEEEDLLRADKQVGWRQEKGTTKKRLILVEFV